VDRLKQKTAVITGAAQGIGAAFAQAFAIEGANVICADILDSDEIVAAIRAAGGIAIGVKTDVTDDESLSAMVAEAETEFGPIEILINNAAIFTGLKLKPFTEITQDEWEQMMCVNVRGVWQASKAVLPSMRNANRGKIINISSGTVYKGPPGQLHYVASKGAVTAMTRSMARELADDKICVNTILPGLTMTEAVRANPAWEPFRKNLLNAKMIRRDMLPEDLIGAALFLASDESDFVTGQSINVDGGVYLS